MVADAAKAVDVIRAKLAVRGDEIEDLGRVSAETTDCPQSAFWRFRPLMRLMQIQYGEHREQP